LNANFRGKGASPTNDFWQQKSRVPELSYGEKNCRKVQPPEYRVHQRHRQTDRQTTDGRLIAYSERNVVRSLKKTWQSPKPANVGNSRRTSNNPQPRATGWRRVRVVGLQKERASHPATRSCRSQCGIALYIRDYDVDTVRNREVLLGFTNSQILRRGGAHVRGPEVMILDPLSLCQDGITTSLLHLHFTFTYDIRHCYIVLMLTNFLTYFCF